MKQAESALPRVFRSLKWTETYLGDPCNYLNACFEKGFNQQCGVE